MSRMESRKRAACCSKYSLELEAQAKQLLRYYYYYYYTTY
jgi:hypothetical protein